MILLVSIALAADPVVDGIVPIPEGTTISIPSKPPFLVMGQSFLLPESYYDQALIKAKKLAILEPAFDQCTGLTERWVSITSDSLDACSTQFESDEELLTELQAKLVAQESRAIAAESKIQVARNQRNVAWAIAGGLVLGAVAVTSVAIGS